MKSWSGTAEGMGRGTDVSLRWEKAAHALCAQVSAEEMEKMGPGWLAKYLAKQFAGRDDVASLLRDACYLLRSAWAFVPPGHELGERIHTFLNGETEK